MAPVLLGSVTQRQGAVFGTESILFFTVHNDDMRRTPTDSLFTAIPGRHHPGRQSSEFGLLRKLFYEAFHSSSQSGQTGFSPLTIKGLVSLPHFSQNFLQNELYIF
jgi:hypothetical protein